MKQTNNNYIFPLFIAITIILFTGNAAKAQRQHTSEERTRVNYSVEDIEFEYKTTETLDKNSILYVLSLQKDKVFQRSMLEEDMQRIKKFYFDNGFFDAFIDTAAVFDTTEETVTIKYIILENKRYTIDKITLLGLEKTNPTVLSAINSGMILMSGEPYNRTAILNETGRILSVLLSNGYYYANLDTADGTVISKYPPGNPDFRYRVNVQLRFIGADRQYSFGNTRINIINNRYGLKDYLISRELTYKKGQMKAKEQLTLRQILHSIKSMK
jgi:outer membrane protein assembly factor BamA